MVDLSRNGWSIKTGTGGRIRRNTQNTHLVYRIARVTGDDHGMTVQEKVNEMTAIARAMTPLTPGAGSTGAGQAGGS